MDKLFFTCDRSNVVLVYTAAEPGKFYIIWYSLIELKSILKLGEYLAANIKKSHCFFNGILLCSVVT